MDSDRIIKLPKNAMRMVKNFRDRTFRHNDGALRCNLAGIPIFHDVPKSRPSLSEYRNRRRLPVILHGDDKQRSLSAEWFIVCAILYQDEEMRRQVDILLPYVIWTAREGTEGGSGNMKNTRRDKCK